MKSLLPASITIAVSIVLLNKFDLSSAKIFDTCSLAIELDKLGISRSDLPDWVCMARVQSGYNTTATGPPWGDRVAEWGIFQINDRWWCRSEHGRSNNNCKVNCKNLLSDDIKPSVDCAKIILKEHGFKAWEGWTNHCQEDKPDTDECFDE